MASEATAGVFYRLFKEVSVCKSTKVTKEFCSAFMFLFLLYAMYKGNNICMDESVNLESLLVLS